MKLFRVFPWDEKSLDRTYGGPLFINRALQGGTRHGIPDLDGILYASTQPVSAVAEAIKDFRGQTLENADLVRYEKRLSLATFEVDKKVDVVNLCDKNILAQIQVDPVHIATQDRTVSQRLSRQLHTQGVSGFLWWSSLEAQWTNVSLFEGRILKFSKVMPPIVPLSIDHPDVIQAARDIGVLLKQQKRK